MPHLNKFIPLDPPFNVTASSKHGTHDLPIETEGVYLHGDSRNTYLHFAGESAEESYTEFVLPSNPEFLRSFARSVVEYAEKLENACGASPAC